MISDSRIDGGKAFDWGRVSGEYARFRTFIPLSFMRRYIRWGFAPMVRKCLT